MSHNITDIPRSPDEFYFEVCWIAIRETYTPPAGSTVEGLVPALTFKNCISIPVHVGMNEDDELNYNSLRHIHAPNHTLLHHSQGQAGFQ